MLHHKLRQRNDYSECSRDAELDDEQICGGNSADEFDHHVHDRARK